MSQSWIPSIGLSTLLLGVGGMGATVPSRPLARASGVCLDVHSLDRRSVEHVLDLGIRCIRWTLYWSLWQDPLYRREWEQGLDRAIRAGLDPLVVVHQPPFGNFAQREAVYQAFARFMKDRVAEFPRVRAWQLWNEMDVTFTDVFGAGHPEVSLRQRGLLYAEMLRLTYPAIKKGNPNALVVTGGIASDLDGGFLEGLYEGNAEFDVLAIHTYGFPLVDAFRQRGLKVRRIMRSHGDKRPLWNTEFGLERTSIPRYSELTPAQVDSVHLTAWRTSIEENRRARIYDRIYGYVLQEGKDLGFGLIRPDDSPRPAYLWLKTWSRLP
jgi:hypothetical protein